MAPHLGVGSMKNRIEKVQEYLTRVFIHEDFDNCDKKSEILEKLTLKPISGNKKGSLELRPCYEAPLLQPDQEKHLFRQMNYFKYKAQKILEKKITNQRLTKAEELVNQAKQIRNQIAESNFRLVAQLLKYNINFYREHSLIDSLLSDAYYDVLKAVDYFDWTRGHKFSTYATWVIKKNFFRDSKEKQKKADKFVSLQETKTDFALNANNSEFQKENEYECQKKLVQSLLVILKHGDCADDQDRQVFILENYFGLSGCESQTLEEISQKLNITKERVRQLKEKGLKWLKTKVTQMNLNYESSIESFYYA